MGIYSAGLGKREAQARILFAGIQSIHRRAQEVGHTDLVLIDEAHLIPGNSSTMYRRFLDRLAQINPALKVIGLTATSFRLDCGMLHEGKSALFTDIAYEAPVRELIDAGYLSPLVSKQPKTRFDVSKVLSRPSAATVPFGIGSRVPTLPKGPPWPRVQTRALRICDAGSVGRS